MNKAILDTGINQAPISDVVWCKSALFHLLKGIESLVYLVHLAKCFNEDAICDC